MVIDIKKGSEPIRVVTTTSSDSGLLKSHLPRACQEMEQNAGRRVILYQLPMKTDWRLFSEGRVHILRNTRLPWTKIKEPVVIQQNTPHVQTPLNYCKPKMYVNGWVPEDTSCWRLRESVILQCCLVNSVSTCNSCSVWRPLNRFWKVTGRSYICDAVVGYVSTSMDTAAGLCFVDGGAVKKSIQVAVSAQCLCGCDRTQRHGADAGLEALHLFIK